MMLTTSNIGNGGRLGNQLFNIAAIIGMATKHGHTVQFPEWSYSQYFENPLPTGDCAGYEYHEPTFHYNQSFVDGLANIKQDHNLKGYFQSERYFEHCTDVIRKQFKFKHEFIEQVRDRIPAFDKTTIAISIRRGDYVNNSNYRLLPINHYITALFTHFPNWRDCNLVIFSDDIPYCRVHFGCLENAYFSENNSDIEDIALMSQCDHFVIANSTFSFWGAYLGEKEGTKIVRPVHHFNGDLARKCDIKDYYPERWIIHDHETAPKLDLSDVTFTIPVYYDHPDRRQNLELSVCLLQHSFKTNIMVMENKTKEFVNMKDHTDYWQSEHLVFHRTKMLNEMAELAATDIIVNWDADVIIPPMQIWLAVEAIRKGADMVYPYDGRFARIPRQVWFKPIEYHLDIGLIGDTRFTGMSASDNLNSVGGAVIWRRSSFLKIGGENEHFISFGAEDAERIIRARVMGLMILRVPGCLYHVNHWVGPDSSTRNPYFHHNKVEFERISAMSREELEIEINSWEWLAK